MAAAAFVESASDERAALRELSRRRDAPGLVRLGVQATLLVVTGLAAVWLAAAGNAAWPLATVACGLSLLPFFATLHEAGHRTAFRTHALNEGAVWIGAIVNLQVPSFFREFHWEHHRSTQDREHDPEIAKAPELLDDWPGDPLRYLLLASGQLLLVGRLGFTLGCALLPGAIVWRQFPFVRPAQRARVVWESRVASLVLVGSVVAGLAWLPGFGALLLAWPVGHVALGLYLMPEHTGLPNVGSQLERTRTLRSNALVRWLMWNMPYHAEHHAHPGVPFHAVPRLHRLLEPQLVHVTPGYRAFHAEAWRRARKAWR